MVARVVENLCLSLQSILMSRSFPGSASGKSTKWGLGYSRYLLKKLHVLSGRAQFKLVLFWGHL